MNHKLNLKPGVRLTPLKKSENPAEIPAVFVDRASGRYAYRVPGVHGPVVLTSRSVDPIEVYAEAMAANCVEVAL